MGDGSRDDGAGSGGALPDRARPRAGSRRAPRRNRDRQAGRAVHRVPARARLAARAPPVGRRRAGLPERHRVLHPARAAEARAGAVRDASRAHRTVHRALPRLAGLGRAAAGRAGVQAGLPAAGVRGGLAVDGRRDARAAALDRRHLPDPQRHTGTGGPGYGGPGYGGPGYGGPGYGGRSRGRTPAGLDRAAGRAQAGRAHRARRGAGVHHRRDRPRTGRRHAVSGHRGGHRGGPRPGRGRPPARPGRLPAWPG